MVVHFFIMYIMNLIGEFATDCAPFSVAVAAFYLATIFEIDVARFAVKLTLWANCFNDFMML